MATFKTYNITDTENDLLNSAALDAAMRADSVVGDVFDGVNRAQGESTFTCHLTVERTTAYDTAMDAVVAAHTGTALLAPASEVVSQPFATKVVGGKSLFARNHGCAFSLSAGSNTKEFVISYPHVKFTEIEIIGAELGDYTQLKILDTATGTYSTVPNYQLNQFGFSVYLKPDHYRKSCRYDADLYTGMRVVLEYESVSAKNLYVNFTLHEVK